MVGRWHVLFKWYKLVPFQVKLLILRGVLYLSWLFHWYWTGTYHHQSPEVRSDEVVPLWCHQPVKGEVSEQTSTPYPTSVKFRCFCLKHFSIQSPTRQSSTRVGFHIFQAVKEKERFGFLKSDSWGPKRIKTLLRLSIPKRFWVKTSNLQQAPKLWRISKSSILIYRGLISPPREILSDFVVSGVFSPKPSFSETPRNLPKSWCKKLRGNLVDEDESFGKHKNAQKTLVFWAWHMMCKSAASDKDTKDNPFYQTNKKKPVFSTHFFWVCNKNGMFFLKFFKSSSVRAVSVVSSISLRLIDGLGPGSGWGNILLSRSSWRARCYNN